MDSPPDGSAHNSTESLKEFMGSEAPPDTSDIRVPLSAPFQDTYGIGGLQNASGSSIGLEPEGAYTLSMESVPSVHFPPMLMHYPYQHSQTLSSADLSHGPRHEMFRQRSSSVPNESRMVGPPLAGIQTMPAVPEIGNFAHSVTSMPESGADFAPSVGTASAGSAMAVSQNGHQPPPPPAHSVGVDFSQISPMQTEMLTDAFARFLHAMHTMLRDPSMQPMLVMLDQRFGSQPQQPATSQHPAPPPPMPPQPSTPTTVHEGTTLSPTEPTQVRIS